MEKIRKYLSIISIISALIGIISIIKLPIFGIIEIIIAGGILMVKNQDDKFLLENKTWFSIFLILLIIFNQIGAIIMFLTFDEISKLKENGIRGGPIEKFAIINQNNKVINKPKIDPEVRKIDILLKLGVTLVVISGLLFATTSWESINNITKVIALIVMGLIFLGLSKISEKKLHIETTTFTYWLLAMFFFIFSIIAMGALEIFGTWLSYYGEGKSLMYAITYSSISVISYLTYKKKNNELLKYIMYTGIFITTYNILRLIKLDSIISINLIKIIMLVINILQKTKKTSLQKFTIGGIYVLSWLPLLIYSEKTLPIIIACITSIFSVNYICLEKNNKEDFITITSSVISYILLAKIIELIDLKDLNSLMAIGLYTIYTSVFKYCKINNNELYQKSNDVLYYIFSISNLLVTNITIELPLVISSFIILIFNIINSYMDKNEKINLYIQPITIFIFILCLFEYLTLKITLESISVMAIIALVYTGLHYLLKNDTSKKINYWCSIVSLIIALMISIDYMEKITSAIVAVCFLYHYLNEKTDKKRTFIYLGFLFSIFITFISNELLGLSVVYNSLITLFIYLLIKFILKETQTIEAITSIAMVIPANVIVNNLELPYEYIAILQATLALYIVYLIVTLLIKKQTTKSLVAIIGIALVLLTLLEINLIIGIYIGIVGILVMMIGYNREEYKELFITGIVIIIINIIFQLNDLWAKIPFWLYLLITGLGLIFFVTYKELKKQETKSKEISNDLKTQTTQITEKNDSSNDRFQIEELDVLLEENTSEKSTTEK